MRKCGLEVVGVAVKRKDDWFVQLGEEAWLPFTHGRPADGSLRLLGSVRRGPRVGALGITEEGHYVQVNGDHISVLNRSQLHRAVTRANALQPRSVPARNAPPAPVVVIKRRRIIARL